MKQVNQQFFGAMAILLGAWSVVVLAISALHYGGSNSWDMASYSPFGYHWLMLGVAAIELVFVGGFIACGEFPWPELPERKAKLAKAVVKERK